MKKEDIVKVIQQASGGHSVYEIFSDWIHLLALEISVAVDWRTKEFREEEWGTVWSRYSNKEREAMAKATAHLIEAFEEEPEDVLGWCHMHLETSSKSLGQFFTPYHLCELMAKISLDSTDDYSSMAEPSCGAGGNIIAMLCELKRRGINYQKEVDIVAQDLDWRCVYMCYVQLSLIGAKAIVVQGDTLRDPYIPGKTERRHIFITPMRAGAII